MAVVWLRNGRPVRTPTVRNVAAFAAVLRVGDLTALYFVVGMLFAADPQVHLAVDVLRALEFAALAVLTSVTVQ